MDLFFPYLLHIFVLLVSLSVILFALKRKPSNSKFPPGSTGWPVVGEMWEFVMAGRRGCPDKFIKDRMKRYSSEVFQTSLFAENLAVFCGASGNKFLFSNENKYVSSWWPPAMRKVFHFPEGVGNFTKEESVVLRNFLPEFLKPEALQHYIPIMDSMAKDHLESEWSPHDQVTVLPLSKKYTFALALRLFISVRDPQQVARFANPFALISSGLMSIPVDLPGTAFNGAVKGGKIISDELLAFINQRKKELSENKVPEPIDLLTRILIASKKSDKPVNEKEIASNIIGFLIASYDSTSASIAFVLKYLAEYPHVYREVFKEQMEIAKSKKRGDLLNWDDVQRMKYSWCVACEVLRISPPAQGAFRQAITDFTYAGYTIPKGWKTYWSVHSTHKDPKYFPDPEKFDPSRFEGNGPAPYTFVPFGGGPRMCPGKEFARLEILVYMHNVVTKFKWEKLIPEEKIVYKPYPMPENGLPIRLSGLE
ncbi:hypothetical protein Tsubulata_019982 [Turnera subulata]|uniref:Cytochrome P450 n=1 Tax=Turnera subulata TaxID=218843 RepID=A0A9Q0GEL8_9ROSI|nr:hypothetical protein Tsubulata_019982 [Turnera subulata]